MTLVVDASVAAKLFVEEADSKIARRLFLRSELLVAPAHFLGEIGEVGVRRLRAAEITRDDLARIHGSLRVAIAFVSLPLIFDASIEIAVESRISFYDALYVAAAERWTATLVTADERLVGRLSGSRWSGLAVSLPLWAERAGSE